MVSKKNKVPKYVYDALKRRCLYAIKLTNAGAIVDDFICERSLGPEFEDFDWLSGVEIYANPYGSYKRVKEIFERYEKDEDRT